MQKHLNVAATVILLTIAAPALAQTGTTGTGFGTTATTSVSTNQVTEERGFDWGWLGLIGLAGLAGLARREPERVRTQTTQTNTHTNTPR